MISCWSWDFIWNFWQARALSYQCCMTFLSWWQQAVLPLPKLQQHDITLTHWGRVAHICVSKLTIIGSDNGLLPGRRQAIIWTNVGILLIGPLGTNSSEILIEIGIFSLKEMYLEMAAILSRPQFVNEIGPICDIMVAKMLLIVLFLW